MWCTRYSPFLACPQFRITNFTETPGYRVAKICYLMCEEMKMSPAIVRNREEYDCLTTAYGNQQYWIWTGMVMARTQEFIMDNKKNVTLPSFGTTVGKWLNNSTAWKTKSGHHAQPWPIYLKRKRYMYTENSNFPAKAVCACAGKLASVGKRSVLSVHKILS